MQRNRQIESRRVWLPLAVALLFTTAAAAQDPVVETADPNTAEQGTYDLVVTVGGDHFPSDAEVEFFVNGSTTNNGGITVKKVKRQGPKTLKVTIDVAEDAQTSELFDIEVRSRGGRKGKGTELFRVSEKSTGSDGTPPGEPTNLQVLEARYGSVRFSWTMPADDGYDPASGGVFSCDVSASPPSGVTREPSLAWCEGGAWASPGAEQVCVEARMQPEATYLLGVSCRDEVGNRSTEAQALVTTQSFALFQDPSWTIEEVPVPVDALLGHAFDAAGNVVIAGIVDLWEQKEKGRWSPIPTALRIIIGTRNGGAGGWDWSAPVDLAGPSRAAGRSSVSRFRIDSQNQPAFASWSTVGIKSPMSELVYTFHDGVDWLKEIVTAEPAFPQGLGFVFDPQGNPAIAWCSRSGSGGIRLARRDASAQWHVESVNDDCDRGNNFNREVELTFDDAGHPVIGYSGAFWSVVRWSGEQWVEEPLSGDPANETLGTPSPIYDPVRADVSAAGWNYLWSMFVCDRAGAAGWQCANPFLGGIFGGGDYFGLDQRGDLFLAYSTEADKDVTLARRATGASTWTQEHVDHPSMHAFPFDGDQEGPYLAFDPLDRPTLVWTWNVGSDPPTEHHLFFSWKHTP